MADPHEGVGIEYIPQLRRGCATVRPFKPGPVDLGFSTTEIVYEVTATTPGRVRIEGAEVSYDDDDGRAGEQHVGIGVVLVFAANP